jgi:small ligand-binding sensory domain FIST
LPELVRGLAEAGSCYLVGGLTASRAVPAQVASRQGEVRLVQGGLSGVLFSDEVAVAAGLTQGCTPIGPVHQITAAEENVIQAIDNEPALDVFKRDVGELLARDLRRVAGYIHAAIPVTGSDTGDYLVRNLAGIDPKRGWIAIAEYVNPGDRVLFCRRDGQSAAEDLGRMLNQLKRRGNAPPKGGLYFSCVARGPHMFGDESAEQSRIEGELGSFPLSGFYANGEICNDRLYGYTGVLALFLA